MQNASKSKIKRTEKGTFVIEGDRILKAIPSTEEENTWDIVDASTVVELDDLELKKVKATGSDMEKVLKVKRLLLQKLTPTQIEKETSFSRTTIYRYKKLLSAMNAKKPQKNTQSTKTLKSVLPIYLFIIGLPLKSTILILLPLFVLWFYLKTESTRKKYIQHNEEISKLKHLFTLSCNYSFLKKAIVCASDKEAAYFKKVLAHYHNISREIIVLPIEIGEANDTYFDRKEAAKRQYNLNNSPKIKEGKEANNKYWEKLQELNLLDYFHFPKGANWLESKSYIISAVEFLQENPEPRAIDRAKEKYLLEALPNSKLTKKEKKKLKRKPSKVIEL